MVRAGIRFAHSLTRDKLLGAIDHGLDFQYNITGHQTGKINVFHSDFSYFVVRQLKDITRLTSQTVANRYALRFLGRCCR